MRSQTFRGDWLAFERSSDEAGTEVVGVLTLWLFVLLAAGYLAALALLAWPRR